MGERAASMYRQGLGLDRIAAALGVTKQPVVNEILARGIALRGVALADVEEDATTAPRREVDESTLTGRLIATKGRWSDLSSIAAQHGWSSAKAQQEYHKARVSA